MEVNAANENKQESLLPENIKYAGFNDRLIAFLADCFLIVLLIMPIFNTLFHPPERLQVIAIQYENGTITEQQMKEQTFDALFNQGEGKKVMIDSIYQTILLGIITVVFWHYKQATPGKMLLSLRVVDEKSFAPASDLQLVFRYIGYIISMLPCGVGFIWIGVDKKKRSFHDMIAGTIVIKLSKKKNEKTN